MNKKLNKYLENGISKIINGALAATVSDPRERLFAASLILNSKTFSKRRKKQEENGRHVPPFIICSITNRCNLDCDGCYAKENMSKSGNEISHERWNGILDEAEEMGIQFALLAGGEPMMRLSVIKAAARHENMTFPVFTNGTLWNENTIEMIDKNRNIIPVISIEGGEEFTDERRGQGTYSKVYSLMNKLNERKLLYGNSITLTAENLENVTSEEFIEEIHKEGVRIIFYVEYVPFDCTVSKTPLNDSLRSKYKNRVERLKSKHSDMIFIGFPGNELESGGCLAAGRGFLHINPFGDAEPCPFSPFSDINVKEASLMDALKSPLFKKLQKGNILKESHDGGCVLFGQEERIQQLLHS